MIKKYDGDVEDLCLVFALTDTSFGDVRERELIPGGSSIPVTNSNRGNYIRLMANSKLNSEIALQSMAFLRGFRDLIPLKWLRMFNAGMNEPWV
jgi:hypothetical protein